MPRRVLLVYRHREYGRPGSSILGLGVNAMHTVAALRDAGYVCDSVGVWQESDVVIPSGIDSLIVEAPWMSIEATVSLALANPSTHIAIRCHSNLAFLQVEPATIPLMRDVILHGESISNLDLASNSPQLADFLEMTYHGRVVRLPNLYRGDRPNPRVRSTVGTMIRSGSFGAIRLQKNHITGAAAALMLARERGVGLEFHLMRDGMGGGKSEVLEAISASFNGLSWARLIVHDWVPWPMFRRIVMEMDVAFHLTSSETFSLATADCVAEGVPVVGSPMVRWLPRDWIVADIDDPSAAARIGGRLLNDTRAPEVGRKALAAIGATNLREWEDWLGKP